MTIFNAIFTPTIEVDDTGHGTHLVRRGMLVGVVMVGGFFLWSCLAPLSGAIIAEGKIKISNNRKTVQHLEGGIVKEILVHDGDIVKAGQPLIILENTRSSAELNILSDQYDALLAKEARLMAQKTLASKIVFPALLQKPSSEKREELMAKETALFQIKLKIFNDQVSLLRSELEHSKNASLAYSDQVQSIEQNIKYKQEQLEMREGLLQKNFVGKADVLNFKQSLLDKKEQMSAQMADLNNTKATISELELRILDAKNKYLQDADNDLKETSHQLFEVLERIRPAQDSNDRRTLAAPIGGQVIASKITTVGGVINPGQPVLDIVPVSDDLIIEVGVKPTDIESMHLNQIAEIQLNAYNQRTTPMVGGKVIYVAGDAIENPQNGTSTYPAHIKIDVDAIKKLQHVKIEPGMPVTAYIKTQDRTLMEYFLSPLTQRMRHTFREE